MRTWKWIAAAAIAGLPVMAAAGEQPAERPIVLRAAKMLDGRGGTVQNAELLVVGGRIVAVGGPMPKDAVIYDLGRRTIMPGMIDTHEHIFYHFRDGRFVDGRLSGLDEAPEEAILYAAENGARILEAGVTTIQSPGNVRDKWVRDAFARNLMPGPRVRTSLQWLRYDPPGSAPPPEQLRAVVRERKEQGADFIKIFASASERDGSVPLLSQEQLGAICDEATKQGLRTLVHAYTVAVKMATEAGCTTIEHGNHGMTPEVVAEMAKRGTYFDPTLGVADENYVANRTKFIGIGNYTPQAFDNMARLVAADAPPQELIDALKTRKLKVVLGTDGIAGAHGKSADSLVYYIRKAHMEPMRAVMAATSIAAESMGLEKEIGAIAPGMRADIIALDGDPLEDATAFQRPRFVMKAGRVFRLDPPSLDVAH